jgi:hypothetical protein
MRRPHRGAGGIGLGPLLDEALGMRDLEERAGQEHQGEDAREHPTGHALPFRDRICVIIEELLVAKT